MEQKKLFGRDGALIHSATQNKELPAFCFVQSAVHHDVLFQKIVPNHLSDNELYWLVSMQGIGSNQQSAIHEIALVYLYTAYGMEQRTLQVFHHRNGLW